LTEAQSLRAELEEIGRYLEDTIVVDWQSARVLERARSLRAGCEAEADRIRVTGAWVRNEIGEPTGGDPDEAVACSASQVLEAGRGLAVARCHLLVALLRASGIPAGFGYQRLRSESAPSGFALHGFVAVWLAGTGVWRLLTVDAGEGEDTVREPDLAAGELRFPLVYVRPSKRVVDLLERAGGLEQVRRHWPDAP